jgi:protein-tyrosine phosphatase
VEDVFMFIEEAFSHYEACMIHSVRGRSRAMLVAAAYLMRKYEWDAIFSIEVVSACRRVRMRDSFEKVCFQITKDKGFYNLYYLSNYKIMNLFYHQLSGLQNCMKRNL